MSKIGTVIKYNFYTVFLIVFGNHSSYALFRCCEIY